jgi:alpha-glucosidase
MMTVLHSDCVFPVTVELSEGCYVLLSEAGVYGCSGMTCEGIHGLEQNMWSDIPVHHYAVLPFTRLVAGHGDFTPTTFQERYLNGTAFAQQLATAVVYTSPLLCWADKPEVYLDCPFLPLIQTLP